MEAALRKTPCSDAEKGPGFVTVQAKDCGIRYGRHITPVNQKSLLELFQDLSTIFLPICDIPFASFFAVQLIGYPFDKLHPAVSLHFKNEIYHFCSCSKAILRFVWTDAT